MWEGKLHAFFERKNYQLVTGLYGHSFKPLLEFVLSLLEASRELGLARPLALFGTQICVDLVQRRMMPPLGKMVAKEAELEGTFRHAHGR